MKKKTNIRTIIRKIVREEVAMAIHEVITELKQPSQVTTAATGEIRRNTKPQKKIVENQSYSANSVLNDVLNETAQSEEWKSMGGGTYDSSKMNEVMSSQYGDLMNDNTPTVNPNDPMSQFVNKDYSEVLKKAEEKSKQKRGM